MAWNPAENLYRVMPTTKTATGQPRAAARLLQALMAMQATNESMTVSVALSFLTVVIFEDRSMREYAELLDCSQSTMSRHLLDLGEMNRKRAPGMLLIEQRADREDPAAVFTG